MTRQRPRLRIVADGKEARARSRMHWFIQKAREDAREEDEQTWLGQVLRDQDALDAYNDRIKRQSARDQQDKPVHLFHYTISAVLWVLMIGILGYLFLTWINGGK